MMHVLMRHWIVRCNRRVKDAYPFWRRPARFARRRDEDARRHRQRNKPPPKNFTARFFAINLEYHLPTISPQQIPSGQTQDDLHLAEANRHTTEDHF